MKLRLHTESNEPVPCELFVEFMYGIAQCRFEKKYENLNVSQAVVLGGKSMF